MGIQSEEIQKIILILKTYKQVFQKNILIYSKYSLKQNELNSLKTKLTTT